MREGNRICGCAEGVPSAILGASPLVAWQGGHARRRWVREAVGVGATRQGWVGGWGRR